MEMIDKDKLIESLRAWERKQMKDVVKLPNDGPKEYTAREMESMVLRTIRNVIDVVNDIDNEITEARDAEGKTEAQLCAENEKHSHFTVEQLMNVMCATRRGMNDCSRGIMFYEYDDDSADDYDESDWDSGSLFVLGTGSYLARKYLRPELAFAEVARIWAVENEPVRVMIVPAEVRKE